MDTRPTAAVAPRAVAPLLFTLFCVRFLYLGVGRLITWPAYPDWLLPSEQVATYLLIASLIFVCRPALASYHLTRLALALFLFAPALARLGYALAGLRLEAELIVLTSQAAIAVVLSILLLWQRRFPLGLGRDTAPGLMMAAATGVALGIAFGTYFLIQRFGRIPLAGAPAPFSDGFPFLVGLILIQLGGAAVLEEPLFRGFGWGALRDWGLRDLPILIVQGSLFTISHIYYLRFAPFSFWIIIPASALILGLLAWRTRSIGTTLIAHSLINAVAIAWGHV